jgi:hypothetical protein
MSSEVQANPKWNKITNFLTLSCNKHDFKANINLFTEQEKG